MRSAIGEPTNMVLSNFSYTCKPHAGPGFFLVGDAGAFLDPIFSTGVFMAMKSADIAAEAVARRLATGSMRALRRYERAMSGALRQYFRFISQFYRREFLEVFMQPKADFGLLRTIVGILAGNVFTRRGDRLKLAVFFALVRIQKRRPLIAPRIEWESLPAAASV